VGLVVEVQAPFAAVAGQEFRLVAADVGHHPDAQAGKTLLGALAHAGDLGHGQGAQEIQGGFRGDDGEPVGLVVVRGDLGDEFDRRDANGTG